MNIPLGGKVKKLLNKKGDEEEKEDGEAISRRKYAEPKPMPPSKKIRARKYHAKQKMRAIYEKEKAAREAKKLRIKTK